MADTGGISPITDCNHRAGSLPLYFKYNIFHLTECSWNGLISPAPGWFSRSALRATRLTQPPAPVLNPNWAMFMSLLSVIVRFCCTLNVLMVPLLLIIFKQLPTLIHPQPSIPSDRGRGRKNNPQRSSRK